MSGRSSIPRPIPDDVPESLRAFTRTMKKNARRIRYQRRLAEEAIARRYTLGIYQTYRQRLRRKVR